MTAPYIPSQSGWKPRKPATDLLTSTLGNRFGVEQQQPTAPPSPYSPAQPQGASRPQPFQGSTQTPGPAGPPAPAPVAANPFRPQALAAPSPPPATPPPATAPQSPPGAPPATANAPANFPPVVTTNADGTRTAGAYTVGPDGSVARSPYSVPGQYGQGPQYNWGAYGTGPNRNEGFNRLTAEDYAAISALDPEGAKMWRPDTDGSYRYDPNAAGDAANGITRDPRTGQILGPDGKPVPESPGPARSQGYSMFGDDPELDALVRQGLAQPSRYDNELVTSMWDSRAGDIDTEYDEYNRGLGANLSRRGIRDSTFGGEAQQRLAGERRTAKSRMSQSLFEDIAGSMSEDRSRAISDALGLKSQREGSRQFDANYGLAERFGADDRRYRDRESDWRHDYDTETFNADRQDSSDALYRWLVQQGLM